MEQFQRRCSSCQRYHDISAFHANNTTCNKRLKRRSDSRRLQNNSVQLQPAVATTMLPEPDVSQPCDHDSTDISLRVDASASICVPKHSQSRGSIESVRQEINAPKKRKKLVKRKSSVGDDTSTPSTSSSPGCLSAKRMQQLHGLAVMRLWGDTDDREEDFQQNISSMDQHFVDKHGERLLDDQIRSKVRFLLFECCGDNSACLEERRKDLLAQTASDFSQSLHMAFVYHTRYKLLREVHMISIYSVLFFSVATLTLIVANI